MVWATVSSQSYFYWLYRASQSLAAKNTINLISVLTIWWCLCVESSLVLLEEGICHDQCILFQNSVRLCPALFCTPRPNLSITPAISWLSTFAFQFPIMKMLVGAQYATGEQRRNKPRKNEEMEPKQKQHPVINVTGNGSKVQCCKEHYCIGTRNVRSMNQCKFEVVK